MKRAVCPDGQLDMFSSAVMAECFLHPQPDAPLPPMPFERNEEIDLKRVAKILNVHEMTVRRMLAANPPLLRGYTPEGRKRGTYRIEYASVLEHCDKLCRIYQIARKRRFSKRIPDKEVLPFPANQSISVQEVMDHLDLNADQVIRLIDDGTLTGYQLIPESKSPWRIDRTSFVRYMQDLHRQAGRSTAN